MISHPRLVQRHCIWRPRRRFVQREGREGEKLIEHTVVRSLSRQLQFPLAATKAVGQRRPRCTGTTRSFLPTPTTSTARLPRSRQQLTTTATAVCVFHQVQVVPAPCKTTKGGQRRRGEAPPPRPPIKQSTPLPCRHLPLHFLFLLLLCFACPSCRQNQILLPPHARRKTAGAYASLLLSPIQFFQRGYLCLLGRVRLGWVGLPRSCNTLSPSLFSPAPPRIFRRALKLGAVVCTAEMPVWCFIQ